MKIVQLLPELNEGGVERGVVELNRELVRRGHESVVISAGGRQASQIEVDGGRHVTFDVCSKNPLTAFQRVRGLRRLLRELAPDILHARSRVPAWLAWLANRRLQIPFVTTVHGFNSVNAYSRVMTFGDRVICVSGAIRDHVRRHYDVPEEKLVVIPRGVDLDAFDPNRVDREFMTRFRAEHRLEGRWVVTAVGRITQLKDYETFIRAIGELGRQRPEAVGLIVGGVREDKRDYFASLQRLVTELGLEDRIVFAGSQQRIAEIYALSDVVVSSSKKPESFGRAAAEALAMNVPVVASRHGGVLDIVREGQTGFLFAPGDDAELARQIMRAAGLDRSGLRKMVEENFSLEMMVDRTRAVYADLGCGQGSS
ncbi:glycosyltransferase involved in cell wall biosynthesis [Geothermobacter ehrlichii]|uniref:Glycosyltransferase involved in cell wall biosynthesis n=1 Tax=Geothermobacter ehrlichii TaxID=213224 RepID=A0A5D3WN95_9BACT|nr:glycosyltransferase family 4 protein [Geothermobacter ehrlichii]TYP00048.1 glycosyltransferase involved in cell wall biosynthesis [Geothermobacter ehrlichii]